MIYSLIQELLNYGLQKRLIDSSEEIYSRNLLLDVLSLNDWKYEDAKTGRDIEVILLDFCHWATKNNLINDSPAEMELLDTKLMNCITPRPRSYQ